ncbi:MAG: methyltransferase domain-containing protein [Verrucomicrobiae bacterium]|nr:methyltransferase domain-containing protein [Verrucomicrobiae bacterium]
MNPFFANPTTDPSELYRLRDGIFAVDLLTTAIVEFDVITKLAAAPGDLAAVCAMLGTARRPTDVMLTLLAANDLITKAGEKFYVSERGREHLMTGSQWCVRDYFASLQDRPVARDMARVLRTGKPANWSSADDLDNWHDAMEDENFAREFTAAMDCRGLVLAQSLAAAVAGDLSSSSRMLDIGGGSGVYACGLVHACPGLTASVLEKPPIDAIAREAIAGRGFADRVEVQVGDMLSDPLPAGFDVHLFSNVLHDWDIPEVEVLLAQSSRALPSGGTLLVHEAFLNESKTGPLPVAEYSAILMHSTQGRCYGQGEIRSFLDAADFDTVRYQDTTADRGVFIARKR